MCQHSIVVSNASVIKAMMCMSMCMILDRVLMFAHVFMYVYMLVYIQSMRSLCSSVRCIRCGFNTLSP